MFFFFGRGARLGVIVDGAVVEVLGLFEVGESSSNEGPAEGVLEPVRAGEFIGESLRLSPAPNLERSWPVTASEVARSPKLNPPPFLEPKLGFESQSPCVPCLFPVDAGDIGDDRGCCPSNFVTVGGRPSFTEWIGRCVESVVLVEAVLRCGPLDAL